MLAALENARVFADRLFTAVAGFLFEGGVHILNVSVGIRDHDRLGRLFNGRGQPLQLCLRSLQFGQVACNNHRADHLGSPVSAGRQGDLHVSSALGGIIEPFRIADRCAGQTSIQPRLDDVFEKGFAEDIREGLSHNGVRLEPHLLQVGFVGDSVGIVPSHQAHGVLSGGDHLPEDQ